MSSAPNAEASFIQEHQTKVERSALFYLFQEVSKLEPPLHEALLDTSTPSIWLNKMSNSNRLLYEEEEERSFQASRAAHRYSLSCERPCTHMKNASEEDGDVFKEPQCECNSPWKVLSLINLHCEQLLHPGGAEEKSASPASRSSQCAPPNGEERSDQESLDCSVEPLLPENVVFAALEGLRPAGPGDALQLQLCVRDVDQGCDVHVQPAEETGPVPSELQEDVSAATLCRSREESSLGEVLEWSQTCTESSSKTGHLDVLFPGKEAQNSTQLKAEVTFSSSSTSCNDQSEPAQTLDHNANITLCPRSACSRQDEELSAAAPTCTSCSPAEDRRTCSCWDGLLTVSPPELCTELPPELCTELPPELCTEQNSQADPPLHQHQTRTPRKQPRPSRSADIQDPDFQGVMFRIAAELDDTKEQCRLLITSKYSNELCKGVRKPRRRARTSQSLRTSSSDDENDLAATSSRSKVCASCCTRKTPMWRDAEDGTPLCNACGIRYKKYRVRCVRCWHIPRKEGNSNSHCLKCGNFVKLTSAQRKLSS